MIRRRFFNCMFFSAPNYYLFIFHHLRIEIAVARVSGTNAQQQQYVWQHIIASRYIFFFKQAYMWNKTVDNCHHKCTLPDQREINQTNTSKYSSMATIQFVVFFSPFVNTLDVEHLCAMSIGWQTMGFLVSIRWAHRKFNDDHHVEWNDRCPTKFVMPLNEIVPEVAQ